MQVAAHLLGEVINLMTDLADCSRGGLVGCRRRGRLRHSTLWGWTSRRMRGVAASSAFPLCGLLCSCLARSSSLPGGEVHEGLLLWLLRSVCRLLLLSLLLPKGFGLHDLDVRT